MSGREFWINANKPDVWDRPPTGLCINVNDFIHVREVTPNDKPWEAMCKKAMEERSHFFDLYEEQSKAAQGLVEAANRYLKSREVVEKELDWDSFEEFKKALTAWEEVNK